jgi:hypothetical protein
MTFELLIVVTAKITIFFDVMLCSVIEGTEVLEGCVASPSGSRVSRASSTL